MPDLSMPGSGGAANSAAKYSSANAMPAIIGIRRSMLHSLCAAATLRYWRQQTMLDNASIHNRHFIHSRPRRVPAHRQYVQRRAYLHRMRTEEPTERLHRRLGAESEADDADTPQSD